MRIALVLASGGARGYAHIGVIDVLKERGHEIVAISGTSMGAVVGGLEAAGRLGEYEAWARTLTQFEVARLMFEPAPGQPGIVRLRAVLERISGMLDGAMIEDLPIPFTAVAADLVGRSEVWFQRGPVDAAIRASMSLPGIFTPVVIDGRVLVDGGILNPVPLEPVLGVTADATLAVRLDGRPPGLPSLPVTVSGPERGTREWWRWLRGDAVRRSDWPRRLRLRAGTADPDAPAGTPAASSASPLPDVPIWDQVVRGLTTREVMSLSFETMQALVARYRAASNPPDAVIDIPEDVCGTLDFHRADEVIDVGYRLAEAELDRLGW